MIEVGWQNVKEIINKICEYYYKLPGLFSRTHYFIWIS